MGRAIRPGGESHINYSKPDPSRRPPSRLVSSLVGAAAASAAFLMFRLGAEPPAPRQVLDVLPPAAVGTWETTDDRYGGRVIFVMEDQVLLDRGAENQPGGGSLVEARQWIEGETTVLRVEFRGPDGPELMEMLFETEGEMRLRNPEDVVWTRKSSEGPASPSVAGSGPPGSASAAYLGRARRKPVPPT